MSPSAAAAPAPEAATEASEVPRAGYGACEEGGQAAGAAGDRDLWRRTVRGLYCQYAAIGIVTGFVYNYLTLPLCQYMFGPMGAPGRTSVQQCDIATEIVTLPWNLKLFYGVFLDRVGLLGTRRKGWIVLGWTLALVELAALAALAPGLADGGHFATYSMLWMAVCASYMFAEVSAEGMTVELSKLEPPEARGHTLTTCQMVRFAADIVMSVVGTLTMNGKSYYPAGGSGDGTVFPFELPFGSVHLAVLALCLPCYIGMLVWLQDPPPVGKDEAHDLAAVASTVWKIMKTKAFLFLVLYSIGMMAVAALSNPADNVITVRGSALHDVYNGQMAAATRFTLCVRIAGTFLVSAFAPQDRKECKAWLEDPLWRSTGVGLLVIAIGGGAFAFSTAVCFLSIFPSTMCLAIAGGAGC